MSSSDKAKSLGVTNDPERAEHRHTGDADARIREFIIEAARLAADLNCEDVVAIDVRSVSEITDYIVIASGTSDRQMKSVANDIEELAEQYGLKRYGHDQDGAVTWLVIDFVDVVVHLFEPTTRAHYDLEMLWGDGEQVAWQR